MRGGRAGWPIGRSVRPSWPGQPGCVFLFFPFPRGRRVIREHVPLADVLTGQGTFSRSKWRSRPGRRRVPQRPRPVRLSKSATKARIPPGRWKKNVDIPGFSSRSMIFRSSFVADLDTLLPGAVPHVPCVSVSLSHRKDPGAGRERREGARRCRGRVRGVGAVPPGSDVRYRGDPGGAAHSIGASRRVIGGIMRKHLSAQRC